MPKAAFKQSFIKTKQDYKTRLPTLFSLQLPKKIQNQNKLFYIFKLYLREVKTD